MSKEQKVILLAMLLPDQEHHDGIKACPGGLGRTLQQMRVTIDLPSDPQKVITWIAGQFKGEILNILVIKAKFEKEEADTPSWKSLIRQLAHDAVHRGNALIGLIGKRIGLPQQMIERANLDLTTHRATSLTDQEFDVLLKIYNEHYSDKALLEHVLSVVNGAKDGSEGLKAFRMEVIKALSEQCTKGLDANEDPAMHVVNTYCIQRASGVPDINEEGIRAYISTLPSANNPFLLGECP